MKYVILGVILAAAVVFGFLGVLVKGLLWLLLIGVVVAIAMSLFVRSDAGHRWLGRPASRTRR